MLVHGRPLVYRDDPFGRRGSVSQSAMRPDIVVVASPPFDQDLRFTQAVEDLTVQKFVSEPCVEALAVSVFRRRTRHNERGFRAYGSDSCPHLFGDKLCAIVRTYVFGWPSQDEQISQGIDHVGRIELTLYADHQRLLSELLDDVERAEDPPVVGPVLDDVTSLDMVGSFRPQPDTRATVQPKMPLVRMFLRDFWPFSPPNPFALS